MNFNFLSHVFEKKIKIPAKNKYLNKIYHYY